MPIYNLYNTCEYLPTIHTTLTKIKIIEKYLCPLNKPTNTAYRHIFILCIIKIKIKILHRE